METPLGNMARRSLVVSSVAVGLVFLIGCGPFREHPPRASDAWEAYDTEYAAFESFTVGSRHYGPGWGRIDGRDVIVFGYREALDASGGLPAAYGGSIYVIRADGTKLKRLSPSVGDGRGLGGEKAAYDISPDVSSDGRWLAYATHRHSNRLMVVTSELDGRDRGRIRPRDGDYNSDFGVPVWAPDGKTLAFSGVWTDRHNVIIAEPDGSNRRVIAPDISPAYERPSWSPDGKLLAFRSFGKWEWGPSEREGVDVFEPKGFILHIAAVDGSSVRSVGEASTRPVWSPDSRHVAVGGGFLEVDGEPQWGIYVLDADGGNLRRIVATDGRPLRGSQLLWSPDGAEVWATWVGGQRLVAVSVATGDVRRIEVLPYGIDGMAWSPDGSRLAIVTQPSRLGRAIAYKDGVYEYEVVPVLYTVSADGSDIRVLVQLEDPVDGEGDVRLRGVPQ